MSTSHPWRGIRPFKRHSQVLLVAGCVYLLIGVSYATTDITPDRKLALHFAVHWMSLPHWGIVFMFAGVLSIISSRWPPISETWGYTVLTGLSAGWAGFYLMGILLYDSPNSNISGVMSWGLIGFLWWAISGLLNPDGTSHSSEPTLTDDDTGG